MNKLNKLMPKLNKDKSLRFKLFKKNRKVRLDLSNFYKQFMNQIRKLRKIEQTIIHIHKLSNSRINKNKPRKISII